MATSTIGPGKKTKGTCTLKQAAQRQAIRLIRNTEDLGDMPFRLAEPLLRAVDNPKQLHTLETNCPQFIGHLDDMWRALLKKDIPAWSQNPIEPRNPASWWKIYKKMWLQKKQAEDDDVLLLKARMQELAEEKNSRMAGTTTLLTKQKVNQRVSTRHQGDQSALRFNDGSRTKMHTGKDVLARARREARERGRLLNKKSVLAQVIKRDDDPKKPVYDPNKSKILFAPIGMVEKYQQQQSAPLIPPPRTTAQWQSQASKKMTPKEREQRLKDAKARLSMTAPPAQPARSPGIIKKGISSKTPPEPNPQMPKRKRADYDPFAEMDDSLAQPAPSKKQHLSSSADPLRRDISPKKAPSGGILLKNRRNVVK